MLKVGEMVQIVNCIYPKELNKKKGIIVWKHRIDKPWADGSKWAYKLDIDDCKYDWPESSLKRIDGDG